MKKMELIKAIVELVSNGILKSQDGYRIIEKIMEENKYGTHLKKVEPTKIMENNTKEIDRCELCGCDLTKEKETDFINNKRVCINCLRKGSD